MIQFWLPELFIDSLGGVLAASEGANLCLFSYDELKAADKRKTAVDVSCFTDHSDSPDR